MRQTHSKIPRNVVIVAFVALASGFGQDLITPVLPAYLALLGISAAGIGLADGLLQGATNVFRFVSGILSDRIRNRKGLVFAGYAFSSLARPFLAAASSFNSILALRFLDGVGKGTKDAPRDALIADSAAAERRGRAFGFHRFVDTAGSVLGPFLATLLLLALTPSLRTYRLIFLLSAIPGALALALIWFGIREPEVRAAVEKIVPRALPSKFWVFTLASTIIMLTKINDSLFLAQAASVGASPAWIPLIFAGFTLIYALLSYPLGVWSDRIGRFPLIIGGWFVLAFVEFGFSRVVSLAPALLLFAFYGLYYALTEGAGRALIADLVPVEARGSAYAIFYTATGAALIAGGYALGRLWDAFSPQVAFEVAAVGSLVGGLLFFLLIFRRKIEA